MNSTAPTSPHVEGIDELADAIADELRRSPIDLDPVRAVDERVRQLAPLASDRQRRQLTDAVTARLDGLDRLEPLLADPTVDEILVGNGTVWAERCGQIAHVAAIGDATTRRIIERVLGPLGRRLDRTSPIVDARLPDGARVCAVVAPVAVTGPTLSIRRFADRARSLDEFVASSDAGLAAAADRCRELVAARCNVVVSGATSSGKTSLLAALLDQADPTERIVVLEDIAELPCRSPHLVRLEARPASPDGPPPITVEQLVRTALRLRPDRLVVGEARGDEVIALIQAMNTGHDGSFSTVHANSATDAMLRIEALTVRAAPEWPISAVRQALASSIDAVVHVERRGGQRVIVDVAEVDAGAPGDDPTRFDRPLALRPLLAGAPLTRRRT